MLYHQKGRGNKLATSKSDTGIWVALGLIGVIGVLFLVTRNKQPATRVEYTNWKAVPRIEPTVEILPEETPVITPATHTYKNSETWEIEWTPDGLPGKVTIHRNAVQT